MKKFLIAAHGNLALGIKSTLDLFLGDALDFTYLATYTDDAPDLDETLDDFFASIDAATDQAVIFTDLYGGSVNQKIALKASGKTNIFVIAGMNLPLIMETASLALAGDAYDTDKIVKLITGARQELKQVELVAGTVTDDAVEIDQEVTETVTSTVTPEPATPALTERPETSKQLTMRVDERLIHGQVAMVWSKALKLDGIVVANDDVVTNQMQENALRMAAPNGIKVIMRSLEDSVALLNDHRSATKNLLVLVRTVKDAVTLAAKVAHFDRINVGNVGKMVEGEKQKLAPTVLLTQPEVIALKTLTEIYPETDFQMVPTDKKELAKTFVS